MSIDSREVAEMVEKNHADLLRDIRTYIEYLGESKIAFSENPKLDSQDFFIESSYKATGNNKTYKCYQITKKGCEFIAHKLTGQKGTLFTATYINRFHQMENVILDQQKQIDNLTKQQEIEARLNNSRVRQANVLLKIANDTNIKEYKQVLHSYASKIVTGEQILPLPSAERKTYSAQEIGDILGISKNMVGRLANANNLKTEEYGKLFYDKSAHSNKQVETFRYYENVIPVLEKLSKGAC
ncbi:regulatory protein Rha [Tissierella praeacuta]|uniref:Rha family transcriptional regulator n=1 Tax=Tissierella praeacuta TaxID=43131 RepID=UPI0010D88F08|nr:Rha family transcriptional regulator [Tissierella praeacuta]TCU72861.1 regulatory protein Rha [Tissierella praeacuta]